MILNPGFETSDSSIHQPGIPADWTVTTLGTGEAAAVFTGDSAYAYGAYETFDHGWTTADPQKLLFAITSFASYGPERFADWAINQGVLALSALESAPFAGSGFAIEMFDNWLATELEHTFVSAIVESFDWGSSPTSLATVQQAHFSASNQTAELFTYAVRQEVQASHDANTLTRVDGQAVVGNVDDRVYLTTKDSTAELPDPISPNFVYVIGQKIGISIKLKTAPSGYLVVFTSSGVGTQYLYSDPDKFWLEEM